MEPLADNQLFGQIALHYKLVTRDQLAEALRHSQTAGHQSLGEVLVDRGILTSTQLGQLEKVYQQLLAQRQAKTAQPEKAPATESTPTSPPAARTAPAVAATPATPQAPPQTPAAPVSSSAAAAPLPQPVTMESLLRLAVSRGASDLHLHSEHPVRLRIHGDFVEEPSCRPEAAECVELIQSVLNDAEKERLEKKGQVDFAFMLEGVARFRANAYRQQNGTDCVFRIIPLEPPTLADLELPESLAKFSKYHQGMVLITGPAGCGKSSTLAALVNLINADHRSHIITIEDPIEYLHRPQLCVINQRQVEHHTESFSRALRAAMREDPDIIVIGELRDVETISLALTAAETGHLVLATLHTTNAISTINRIVGAFPPSQLAQIRTMVSESLRGVISQRLVKKKEGQGRLPALEIMACTKAVSNLIRENKTFQIRSIIQTGSAHGMQLLDNALRELVASGATTREEALKHCEDPKSLPPG